MRKEKKNRKAKRKEMKRRKEKKKGKRFVERKGRKMRKNEREREDFLYFGRSKFDGSRTKVGARSAIYMWIPKSLSFDKLHEVGYFPTLFTFSLKAIKW